VVAMVLVEEENVVEMEMVEEVEVKERRRWRYASKFKIHVLNSNIKFPLSSPLLEMKATVS